MIDEATNEHVMVDHAGFGDVRTITEALRLAGPCATIVVRPGPYREAISLSTNVIVRTDGLAGSVILESADAVAISIIGGDPEISGHTVRVTQSETGTVPARHITAARQ